MHGTHHSGTEALAQIQRDRVSTGSRLMGQATLANPRYHRWHC